MLKSFIKPKEAAATESLDPLLMCHFDFERSSLIDISLAFIGYESPQLGNRDAL